MSAYEIQQDGTLREVADPPERVDLVQVVRCRDCRFCGRGMWGVETFPVCRRRHTFQVSYDGFCAWGKRRESE